MPLTVDDVNPAVLNVQYAVRGGMFAQAEEWRVALNEKDPKATSTLPFNRVVLLNIGNPQQAGLEQPPNTWLRQIAALTEYPELIKTGRHLFPSDAIERAEELIKEIGSIGAYTHSQGIPYIRKNVAKFIEERDGYPSNPDHIFMTGGVSPGVSLMIHMLIRPVTPSNPHPTGFLIPMPQYPLYTAVLAQFSGIPIPYYLDGKNGWATSIADIKAALARAKEQGIIPRGLIVSHPSNPSGVVPDEKTQEELVKICEEHNLVILADEVYQRNVHRPDEIPFVSFKKIVRRMGSSAPLVSYHSISKGITAEGGKRGGYFEATNFSEELIGVLFRLVSTGLCPPVPGQIGVDSMIRPPKPGSPSYTLWKKEADAIDNALASRIRVMSRRLGALPGITCIESPSTFFVLASLDLPEKALEEAKKRGKKPDEFYAIELLHETGICVIPGAAFGEKPGRSSYRASCSCPWVEEDLVAMEKFHLSFMEKYGRVGGRS